MREENYGELERWMLGRNVGTNEENDGPKNKTENQSEPKIKLLG